jgi:shikimate dehydrogenase
LRPPTAATRVAAVIGDPVRQSLSPALHNAAFDALDLDWVYVAFHVPAGEGGRAVEAMRYLQLAGLSVTMPHKSDVAKAVDLLGPVGRRLGVVNTVTWSGDALVGESTDGAGFIDALGDEGFDPGGRSCLVLGAGGAARAVTLALAEAGAVSVTVVARQKDQAASCAALAGTAGRAVMPDRLAGALGDADLVVNATPVGMGPDSLPFELDPDWIRPSQFVADLVYAPATTPLLQAARSRGASRTNGLGMLIHQAARQVEMWTGRTPPLDVMSAAALGALAHQTE